MKKAIGEKLWKKGDQDLYDAKHFYLLVMLANVDAHSISRAPGSVDVQRLRVNEEALVNTHPHKP